ncbi:hypothetical protein ACG3QT_00665 [Pseudomonas paraeruginosa]
MGWLFSHQTKEDLLRELLAPTSTFAGSTEVLAHAVSGNELWTVVKRTFHLAGFYFGKPAGHSITMIELHLLDCSAGQWGYKTIPEKAAGRSTTAVRWSSWTWLTMRPTRSGETV